MRKKMSKKAIAIAVVTTVVLGGAGAAFAYWTVSGGGTGTAATQVNADSLTFTPNSAAVTNLKPLGVPQALKGTVTNPTANSSSYVGIVTATLTSVTKASPAPAGECTIADYQLLNGTVVATDNKAEITVNKDLAGVVGETPAEIFTFGNVTDDATIQFKNSGANQDGCKGATVLITYSYDATPVVAE